jgi:RNA polymerase sigma factor for flagellar operon FliA
MFKTYAEMRVRGAILDSLRDLDWVPRSVRRRAREVEAAYLQIEQEKGRPAEDSEVAKKFGMTLQAFHLLLTELRGLTIICLDQNDDDDNSRSKQLTQDLNKTPLSQYERAEIRDRLASAIDQLPERERQVVALYYIEELTMKEIGLVLGVTESRVSQLHTQAVLRLRSKLSYMKATTSRN